MHAFLGLASPLSPLLCTFQSHARYASVMLSCMSIWSYSVHCKPAEIGLLSENIGALTPQMPHFVASFTGGVASCQEPNFY